MNKLPIRLLQYIINMLDGIDQLHFKMTCKKYRNKIYITKSQDIFNSVLLRNDRFEKCINCYEIDCFDCGDFEVCCTCEEPYCIHCSDSVILCNRCKQSYCNLCKDNHGENRCKNIICNPN